MRYLHLPLLVSVAVITPAIAQRNAPPPLVQLPAPRPATPPPEVRPVATYGVWRVYNFTDYSLATTSNESGSVFGLICGTNCVIYLNMQRDCTHGADYPAMMNGSQGSAPITLRCYQLDGRNLMITPLSDNFVDLFSEGGEVGFALPLNGSRFAVSRFSLNGGGQAAAAAARLVESRRNNNQDGLRDFTI